MALLFERSEAGGAYERLIVLQDPSIGLRALVVLHSTRRGPAFGGIRRRPYADDAAALADVTALAEAMSRKCALAGLSAGGGKTVLMTPGTGLQPDWPACYGAIGRVVEELGGRYVCGPDVGTSSLQLDAVREQTRWVNPRGNDAGASTAAGVLASMRAVFAHLGLRVGPGVRVAVQGLGSVGLGVARGLVALGVDVVGADPHREARDAARSLGVEIVGPSEILESPCDVFAPCALGGELSVANIARLRCRAVCGSANNQLAEPAAAEAMVQRGIVAVPDIVASAGAVIEGVITVQKGTAEDARAEVKDTIDALERVTRDVLRRAEESSQPPVVVAEALADAAIGQGQGSVA